jgi:hypothetical protein
METKPLTTFLNNECRLMEKHSQEHFLIKDNATLRAKINTDLSICVIVSYCYCLLLLLFVIVIVC